jgi:hypothetical protein
MALGASSLAGAGQSGEIIEIQSQQILPEVAYTLAIAGLNELLSLWNSCQKVFSSAL